MSGSWEQRAGPGVCELLRRERPFRFPFDAMMRFAMVIDAVVHEDDLRSALGLEPAPGGDAQALAVTVNVTHYDAFRMLSGRYQPEKLARLDWSGDPGPYLRVISEPYGPPLDAA